MERSERTYWFPAKRYGWGWGTPRTWQGWFFLAVWLGILLPVTPWLAARSLAGFFLFLSGMLAILMAVCYAKGEPPRWRWGEDKKPRR